MESLKNQKFFCAKCNIAFEDYADYLEHGECKPSHPMVCKYCNRFGTYSELYLKLHHWVEHQHFANNAVISELTLDLNSRKFWITIKDHNLQVDLNCDKCDFTYENPDEYSAHYIEKHSEVPFEEVKNRYECSICHMRTDSQSELDFHKDEKHSENKSKNSEPSLESFLIEKCSSKTQEFVYYKCAFENCGYENVLKSKVSWHWRIVHQTLPEPLPIKAYLK